MKVLIGSKNPGKIEGAKNAFSKYFEDVQVVGVSAESGVPDQPVNSQILTGAKNRVANTIKFAKENKIDFDFCIAVESGLECRFGFWQIVNVAVIKSMNCDESIGTSAGFPVPLEYVDEIKNNSLGNLMDKLFDKKDLHSGTGGVGLLTHGEITRIDLNEQAFVMALTKFVNGDIWKAESYQDLVIEKADKSQAKEIADLIARTTEISFAPFYPQCSIDYVKESLNEKGVLERIINTHFYIAKIKNKIIGCGSIGSYWGSETESSLFNIFVDPNYQKLGVGRKIVEALENDEYFARANRIEIPASVVGIPFYKRMGYKHKNDELIYEDGHFKMEKYRQTK